MRICMIGSLRGTVADLSLRSYAGVADVANEDHQYR
jgi:hypothetical protein